MKILLKNILGNITDLEIESSKTIWDIKIKIQEIIGILPIQSAIIFNGKILDDNSKIEECNIKNEEIVHYILLKLKDEYKDFANKNFQNDIVIYISFSELIPIKVNLSETIIEIKRFIYNKIGILTHKQRLIFNGCNMKDNAKLSDYKIKNGDKLSLIPILKGGARIDNLINEENLSIGFDLKLIIRNELKINLIHFDLNITNKENYKYINKFKVDITGGFQAIDDLEILKRY